ncbi:MAG: helix-turn-helix domain-containing protein, partial [Leptospirales bacterium]|nr:helix-turn-helix domain-containing protein [Leptospirales bacterium]
SIPSSAALKKGYVNSCEHNHPAIDGAEAGRTFYSGDLGLCVLTEEQICASKSSIKRLSWLQSRIQKYKYAAPTLEDRHRSDTSHNAQHDLLSTLGSEEWLSLRKAVVAHSEFWKSGTAPKHRRTKERFYAALAERLWHAAIERGATERFISVDEIARAHRLPQRSLYRIVRLWDNYGIVSLKDISDPIHRGHHFHISMNLESQPHILYAKTKESP